MDLLELLIRPGAITNAVLGFYGFRRQGVAEALCEWAISWCDKFKCPPDLMGTSLTRKVQSFSRTIAKVRKQQAFSQLTYFELYSLSPGASNQLEGRNAEFAINLARGDLSVSFRTEIADLDALKELSAEVSRIVEPEYGMGLLWDEKLGPAFFVAGMNYTTILTTSTDPQKKELARSIGGWSAAREGKIWRRGILRDVYPCNFLTSPQLEATIDNISLREWIEAGTDRGKLFQVFGDIMLWEVPYEDLLEVKRSLRRVRLIFDVANFSPSELKRATPPPPPSAVAAPASPPPERPAPDPGISRIQVDKTGPTPQVQYVPSRPEMSVAKQHQYFAQHPPTCLSLFQCELANLPGIQFDGHGDDANVIFAVACHCGQKEFETYGDDSGPQDGPLLIDPIVLRCKSCGEVRCLFDSGIHGYNAECQEPKPSQPVYDVADMIRLACPHCSSETVAVFTRFEYPDDLFGDDSFRGREQEFFTWFTAVGKCSQCNKLLTVADAECA